MPYIAKDARKKYDPLIDSVAKILNTSKDNDELSGEMNYFFFRLAMLLCNEESNGQRKYARMATVSSAMGEAQAEFRRRLMAPYEDEKISTAGDVEL
jgi:hypothetical protein